MTLYRTGISSVMVDILEEAARRGKEVTAIVELKARFDEEANINLAERLEAVGAQVVYGVLGLKTHGKMTLVLRREEVRGRPTLVRYAHLGTGNYHAATTKLYTDFGMLTTNAEICSDMEKAFLHMTSLTKVERLKHLWMAPFTLHRNLLRALAQRSEACQKRQAGAGHCEDERAHRRSDDQRAIRCVTGRREDRSDRTWRVCVARGRKGVVGQHSRALDRRAVSRAPPHLLFSQRRRAEGLFIERRLDGPQPLSANRDRLAGARSQVAQARGGRGPDSLPRRHARRLELGGKRRVSRAQDRTGRPIGTTRIADYAGSTRGRRLMELILWRHADAEPGEPDLHRKLTAKGEKQARRVAEWLQTRLPQTAKIYASPARRAQQTAEALAEISHHKLRTLEELAPGASAAEVIAAADWPRSKAAIVIVGHQPTLGLVR